MASRFSYNISPIESLNILRIIYPPNIKVPRINLRFFVENHSLAGRGLKPRRKKKEETIDCAADCLLDKFFI